MTPTQRAEAIKDGALNAAEDAYFKSRPQIDSGPNRRIFCKGFDRGYEAALSEQSQEATCFSSQINDLQQNQTTQQAASIALAEPAPVQEPVHGDILPPIGSRVFIRHGRDDDAHACTVTGYYAWPDHGKNKRLTRLFVHMVYEGTKTKQARMLCDCFATESDALAAPQAQQPAPPADVPMLTDDELVEHYCAIADGTEWAISGLIHAVPFARAIEQAVRQKAGLP